MGVTAAGRSSLSQDLCCADPAICSGPCEGSFSRTHSIELVVQFLLFERFIKTSSSKKVGNKNDNSSKVSLSQLSLGGTTLKKSSAGLETAAVGNRVVTG